MRELTNIFNRILVPLYGSQADALEKIKQSKDRCCFLLSEENLPVGVIVFKTVLSNEFSQFGIVNSIEIKSLFVVNAENNSGRGLGSVLFNKVVEEAEKLRINHEGIHVTVSETKGESLNFFKRKGFKVVHRWVGKYIRDTTEYLLSCPVDRLKSGVKIPRTVSSQDLAGAIENIDISAQRVFGVQELFAIHNVHWGDIHSLIKLSDGTFISGSKDNALCKWTKEGNLVRVVHEPEPTETSPKDWITATCVLNDEYWIHGERNSRVCVWNTAGDYVRTVKPKLPKKEHKSHIYNTRRVNCLAAGLDRDKPSFFIGFPTVFDEFNLFENRTVSTTAAHKNDWVFCLHPLDKKRLLSVVGGDLAVWEKTNDSWEKKKTLIAEGQRVRNQQRPFISSVTPLLSSPNHFGLGVFDSSVRVLDLEQGNVVNNWKEHTGRIWDLVNVSPSTFATGGEDKSIKFWDVREKTSVKTIDAHVGQVTSLLNLDENLLVAGTCPESPDSKNEGAQLIFYDTRR